MIQDVIANQCALVRNDAERGFYARCINTSFFCLRHH